MASETYIADASGVVRKAKEVWVCDAGGVQRKAKEVWVCDAGGVQRKVFSGEAVVLSSRSISAQATDTTSPFSVQASAAIVLKPDGTAQTFTFRSPGSGSTTTAIAGEWLQGSVNGAGYEVMATLISGVAPNYASSSALDVWLQLSAERYWGQNSQRTTFGTTSRSCVLRLQVRPVGGSVAATADITIAATAIAELA